VRRGVQVELLCHEGRRAVCGPGWWVVTGLGVYAYTAVDIPAIFFLLVGGGVISIWL